MRRPNPYANISLEAPPVTTANFEPPQMNLVPSLGPQGDDNREQMANLGKSLLNIKRRFGGGAKGGAIAGTEGKA